MAEIVASAVASEAVSRISSLVSGDRTASSTHQSAEDKAERLEMAVLKIQSIVAVSEDLQITHLPLLQWKAKLKRVAVEGDSLLHVHKKKTLERSATAHRYLLVSSVLDPCGQTICSFPRQQRRRRRAERQRRCKGSRGLPTARIASSGWWLSPAAVVVQRGACRRPCHR